MDLFDLGRNSRDAARLVRSKKQKPSPVGDYCPALPNELYQEQQVEQLDSMSEGDLTEGLRPMAHIPTLVIGVESDILFPVWQQREIVRVLRNAGSGDSNLVTYKELGHDISLFGHDTFLLDIENVGGPIKGFLEK
jgi:homoserine acetyltransferase